MTADSAALLTSGVHILSVSKLHEHVHSGCCCFVVIERLRFSYEVIILDYSSHAKFERKMERILFQSTICDLVKIGKYKHFVIGLFQRVFRFQY